MHAATHSPAQDMLGMNINNKRHIQPALSGQHKREVRYPQLVRTLGLKHPIDPIKRTRRLGIADRGSHLLAEARTL